MMRSTLLLAFVAAQFVARAQFPFLRSLEVRPGQQRPAITCMAHDDLGLIWVGSDIGLFRTDGERVDVVLRTEGVSVSALARDADHMIAALQNGVVLRCTVDRCDTLLNEPALVVSPVRSMVVLADGSLCLGTYGAGIWVLHAGAITKLGIEKGLPDDHVNDLALLPGQGVVVATDQGLAICTKGRVEEVLNEGKGAPDNLVLSVAVDEHGVVWAGTDRSGVFRWTPGERGVALLDSAWLHGPVMSLAVKDELMWSGTGQGVVLNDLRRPHTRYYQGAAANGAHQQALDLFIDDEGAAWWCDATDRVHRADPATLFIPEHEGVDLHAISALCIDAQDRIWFSTPEGLFHHAAAFSEEREVTRVPVTLDPRTPIVSLAASADGTIWAATFGSGVFAIHPEGDVQHYTIKDGLGNDNVLSVRADGDVVWFATLEGVTRWQNRRFQALASEAGFVFDVLPEKDGSVLMATDGRGILRWKDGLSPVAPDGPRTYYTLVHAHNGAPWAAGPGTGLCKLTVERADCMGAGSALFTGDLFAVGNALGRLISFGSTGVGALDPLTGVWTDLSARYGLQELQAQLNVLAYDHDKAIWMGCDKGLVRIRPAEHHFAPRIPVLFTGLLVDGDVVPITEQIHTPYDRNDITIRFTALHYADPAAIRFEYRMDSPTGKVFRTRDREVVFPDLQPGVHHIQFRAFVGEPGRTNDWRTLTMEVTPPWWRVGWLVALVVLTIATILWVLIRAREGRIRDRDRMEQEKVRFQLEALRSQVDPHFLFNSFNTLVELIETDSTRAVEHVDQLSTFFRNILLVRDKDLITVEEELRLLATYFALEQRRFGAAIDLRVDVPYSKRSRGIVPLTLQLLVENALKHNVATVDTPLEISITVSDGALVVNNPDRPRITAPRSTGFGLDSILKRYAALITVPVTISRDGGVFQVRIPLIPAVS